MQDTKKTANGQHETGAEPAAPGMTEMPRNITAPAFYACLRKKWGWIALRGVMGILFGLLAIIAPLATIWALAVMWGIFALADGVSAFMTGWQMHREGSRWWPYLVFGFIGLAAGILTLLWPAITAFILVYVIAFWAIFGGISQIVAAIRLRKELEGEWILAFAGVIGLLFGLLIFFRPLPEGVLAIAWVVGLYALITGGLYLMLALRIRKQ